MIELRVAARARASLLGARLEWRAAMTLQCVQRAVVRDYMTSAVVSVGPLASLPEVRDLLATRRLSAVPVIDEAGALVGVVSERDLLRRARAEMDAGANELRVEVCGERRAADVMHQGVFTIDEGASLPRAARTMLDEHVHRLVVTRNGAAAGILSTRDAMKFLVARGDPSPLSTIMTSPVETIDVGTSCREAIRRLDKANVRGLVVADGGWPVGVFTHTEALRVAASSLIVHAMPVEQVMSYETICLDASTPAFRVATYSRQMEVRRILAVCCRDLVGIATGVDLLKLIAE